MRLTFSSSDTPARLDRFLAAKLPDLSRTFIQRQIKEGKIQINGKTVSPHYALRLGDEVEVAETSAPVADISPSQDVKFKVIKKTKDFVVIEKPAGLVVHPALGVREPTLANGLLAKYPEIAKAGEDRTRPGIVHRLDRDVSGLMVVGLTQEMYEHLKKQFKSRTTLKEYTALVHGRINKDGIIELPIGRSKNKSGKMTAQTRPSADTKEAKTEYHIIEQIKNYTLLRVIIHTGRTHQIRVHMRAIGYPIVGDTLYKGKKIKPVDLDRLFLHASKLKFNDLNNEPQEFESPLPEELQSYYDKQTKH